MIAGGAFTASAHLLPADSVLLPLTDGQLLVSPSYALFCRVPTSAVEATRAAITDPRSEADLSQAFVELLRQHGFGGPPRPAPPATPSVQLQLTNACNLSCAYCCTDSGAPRAGEVTLEQLLRVVDEARQILGPTTRFGILGGEPFLVPWAIDLTESIAKTGSDLVIFTNALCLGEPELLRRVAALMKRGVELRISLPAVHRELCDSLSGAARFDQAIRVVRELGRIGTLPFVDVMLFPEAVDGAAEGLPGLRDLLPPDTAVQFGILYRAGREQGAHLFGSRRDLEKSLDRIAFEAGEVIPGELRQPLASRRDGCACALGHSLHVRSDGGLFACFKMVEQVGSLSEDSFANWARKVQAHPRPARSLPYCAGCPLVSLCGGGCRTENLELTGDPEQPLCGEWRVRLCAELLAEDRPYALEWPAEHLLAEAHARGIAAPSRCARLG